LPQFSSLVEFCYSSNFFLFWSVTWSYINQR